MESITYYFSSKTRYIPTISGVCLAVLLLIISTNALSHEAWLLTPAQMIEWNMKPRPPMFTQLNYLNTVLIIFSVLIFFVAILTEHRFSQLLFPDFRVRLASYGQYSAVFVRWSLALMLIIAAFGLNPRHGTALLEAPTLVAPDLEIRLLVGNWLWLSWLQTIAALSLILGIYVRITAFIILVVDIIGIVIFGYQMIAYAGIVAASAAYLILEGASTIYIQTWQPGKRLKLTMWLDKQPRHRAQFIMRILAGINLTYLGIEYKFFQPNLSMAFLEIQDVFTFGIEHATFTFCMFLVETLAGILMILGVLTRLLSITLFISFIFIAHITGENPIGHIIIYGILFSSMINGSGHWAAHKSLSSFIFWKQNTEAKNTAV